MGTRFKIQTYQSLVRVNSRQFRTQSPGHKTVVSQLSIFGELEVSDEPNEWGDIEFRIRFEREDGNPLVEFGGC